MLLYKEQQNCHYGDHFSLFLSDQNLIIPGANNCPGDSPRGGNIFHEKIHSLIFF